MSTFCIKKNPTSSMNPWLCHTAPQRGLGDQLIYAGLEDIFRSGHRLVTFQSPEAARDFIAQNPMCCDDQNVIYEIVASINEVFMRPV